MAEHTQQGQPQQPEQQQQQQQQAHNAKDRENPHTQTNATAHPTPQQGHAGHRSPQSLSYHQQQQLHLLHLQRAGGLHKLTADLAGIQLQEAEGGVGAGTPQTPPALSANLRVANPPLLNLPQMTRAARQAQLARLARLDKHPQAPPAPPAPPPPPPPLPVPPATGPNQQRGRRLAGPPAGRGAAPGGRAEQRARLAEEQAHRQQVALELQRERERRQLQAQQREHDQQAEAAALAHQQQTAAAQQADSKSDSESSDHRAAASEAAREAQESAEDAAILKRYKILQLVGTGNYARVYRAATLVANTTKEVAVKSINLSKTTDNYKQKFLPRELSILRRVSHANICKIYEITQVADRIFIVMQFCTRGTIADLLQRNQGPFSEAQTRYLFAPTLDALVYLHSMDIAHRDVKIENILLDQEYSPKLTDFSFSCIMTERSQSHPLAGQNTGTKRGEPILERAHKTIRQGEAGRTSKRHFRLNETFCGTLPYLSPEMIRQFPYDPRKTDVWSLGVCLFVMLNDRLPFPFNDIKTMVRRQLLRDFKFRANVDTSDSCKELILAMLEPNFSRRSTMAELSRHSWMGGPRERPGR